MLAFKYSNDLLIKASRQLALAATVLVCIWNLREESTMIPKSLTDSVGVISLPLIYDTFHRGGWDPNAEGNTC